MDTFGAALFYGSDDVFAERVQLGRVRLEHLPLRGPVAIVVKIEHSFDLRVYRSSRCVWSGISSRCHVFFKRPSKKSR